MYRVELLCREGYRLVSNAWEIVWHWHTWTIENTFEAALAEASKFAPNRSVKDVRIIPA